MSEKLHRCPVPVAKQDHDNECARQKEDVVLIILYPIKYLVPSIRHKDLRNNQRVSG